MSGELSGRGFDRQVVVGEAVADGVAGIPREQSGRDPESADPRVVPDRLGHEKDGGARDHRTARQSIAPDEALGVGVGGRRARSNDRPASHRDERDPPDDEHLPEAGRRPDDRENDERARAGDAEPRNPPDVNNIVRFVNTHSISNVASDVNKPIEWWTIARYRGCRLMGSVGSGYRCDRTPSCGRSQKDFQPTLS